MIKKYPLLLVTAFIAILTSCKKDFEDFDKLDEQSSTADAPYLPLSKGTQWTYNATTLADQDGQPLQEILTVTGKKATLEGSLYSEISVFVPSYSMTITGYLGYGNGVYSIKRDDAQLGTSTIIHYYDEKKAIGESLYNAIKYEAGGETIEARTNTTTVDKNLTKTVHGLTYTEVVHTHVGYELKEEDEWFEFAGVDYYMAKDIGLISIVTTSFGFEVSKEELISFKKGK